MANPRLPEVHVKFKDLGKIIEGTFVVAEITDWGINQNKAVWGKIVRTLEKASENDIAMQSIIYSNGVAGMRSSSLNKRRLPCLKKATKTTSPPLIGRWITN